MNNINMQQLLKRAQQMQKKMMEEQAKLAKMEFEGTAGGKVVKVVLYGTGMVKSVYIDPPLLNGDDKETLEDLLVIAYNNAREKLDRASKESMSDATGGLNNKLPF